MSHALTLADAAGRRRTVRGVLAGVFGRAVKVLSLGAGGLLVLTGIAMAPLPGPLGVPVSVLGLVLILRNSWWAKRRFIRAQRSRPNFVYPFRRLMRKNPEIAPVFWQQALRAEKLVLKGAHRRLIRTRKGLRRRWRRAFKR